MARWRRRTPIGTAHARSVQPLQGRRHKRERSMVCSSWFFTRSSMQIQAWPVHQTRPNLGVGLRRRIDRMKRRGRAAQGERTVRGPVAGLRMNLGTTCTLDPRPRRNSSSSHSSSSRSQPGKAVPLSFWGGLFGPLPGTRDWSIVRVCSSSPPMGCWHVWLTGSVRALGGVLVKRGEGKRRHLSVHHHCMNTGQPAIPPDTHVTSDYQTT